MRSVAILLIFLAGCTGTTTKYVVVKPEANSCQITEVRPTSLSTLVLGVCWDQETNPIGMAGAGGMPSGSVPLAVLGAGAKIGSSYIIGNSLGNLTTGMQR